MLRVLKSELFKAFRTPFFYGLFIMIVLLSIPITGFGANKTVHQVLVFETAVNTRYTEAIQAIRDKGYYARYDVPSQKYIMAVEAEPLLKPGGELYKEYGLLLQEKVEYMQFIEDSYYPADAKLVLESWTFQRVLDDHAAIRLLGIVFAVYFFGQDFTRRGYSAYVLSGRSRSEILAGKFCAFVLVSLLLSVILLIVALRAVLPGIFGLGLGYVMRCAGTRLMMDIGSLCLPVLFPFIFRDVIKSMGAALLFMILFLSNRAILDLHVLDSYFDKAIWGISFSFQAFYPALLTTAGVVAVAYAGSYFIFRRMALK
jgi:hypothetical protein